MFNIFFRPEQFRDTKQFRIFGAPPVQQHFSFSENQKAPHSQIHFLKGLFFWCLFQLRWPFFQTRNGWNGSSSNTRTTKDTLSKIKSLTKRRWTTSIVSNSFPHPKQLLNNLCALCRQGQRFRSPADCPPLHRHAHLRHRGEGREDHVHHLHLPRRRLHGTLHRLLHPKWRRDSLFPRQVFFLPQTEQDRVSKESRKSPNVTCWLLISLCLVCNV